MNPFDRIRKLAFSLEAPNPIAPQIVQAANDAEARVTELEAQLLRSCDYDRNDPELGGCHAAGVMAERIAELEAEKITVGEALLAQDQEIRRLRSGIQDIADKDTGGLEPDVYAYSLLEPN